MAAQPFRILILGDFTGSGGNRSAVGTSGMSLLPLAARKICCVDRDNLSDILRQCAPKVSIELRGDQVVTLSFSSLDDFHPDRLYAELDVFASYRSLRQRLLDPQTFERAAEELRGPPPPTIGAMEAPPVGVPLPSSLLRHALQHSGPQSSVPSSVSEVLDWTAFLRRYVDPVSVARPDARLKDLLASLDEAVSQLLREILHHPDFQALEATWRGIEWLVRRLETGANIQLYFCDVKLEEIGDDPSGLRVSVRDHAPPSADGTPWSLIVGDYTCSASDNGIASLRSLGQLANEAQVPILMAADSSWFGAPSIPAWIAAAPSSGPQEWQDAWNELRKVADFQRIGLAAPRFLLRRPYGAKSDPICSFPFEEVPIHVHDHFLWGNPIWIAAYLSGAAVLRYGSWRPGELQVVDELPVHIYSDDGDPTMLPCAEVLLTEDHVREMLACGIMPLLSVVNQACVRWPRFCNVGNQAWDNSR